MRVPSLMVVVVAVVASACGSDDGEGTGSKCSQGVTRACLGPGACDGAQSCGADRTWSACDCGGGSGGAEAGGAGGSGGGAGDASSGGGSGDVAGDASNGGSGGTQWQDDPCPTKTPIIDCSTSCGGPSANCAKATCDFAEHGVVLPQWPVVIRTPSHPGWSVSCSGCPIQIAFGIGLTQGAVTPQPGKGLKVTVPKPWSVRLLTSGTPETFCATTPPPAQCAVYGGTAPDLVLRTTDPNAPAVNVVIEEVPWPASCP